MSLEAQTHRAPAAGDWRPSSSLALELAQLGRRGWIVGALAASVLLIGFFVDGEQLMRSYLVGYLFWLSIALGSLALSMIHHLTGGAWGLVLRRVLEAATRLLPWLALGFVPIALSLDTLYPWSRPDEVAASELLQHKAPYLNDGFFLLRAALYFAIWIALSWVLNRASARQDGGASTTQRSKSVSSIGLGLFMLTGTFTAIDWMMSLQPEWFSTIYGVYFVGGAALSALCFAVLVALFLSRRPPMDRAFAPRHFHDYGKLMLAFVMLWAYFGFSQFLIIWSGNLPGEISFYRARAQGGWQILSLLLVAAHFILPFVLLLSRDLKRHAKRLAWVAGAVLIARWIDLLWQVAPAFHPELSFHWLDLAAPLAVGGICFALLCRELSARPLIPVGAPELEEALGDE